MPLDPIVQEVREAREAYARRFNYDLRAICRDLQEQEKKAGSRVVALAPKRIEPSTSAAAHDDEERTKI